MNGSKIALETVKYLYCIVASFAFILLFAFLLDVFCIVFLGGMKDPLPLNWEALLFKHWPILNGTISFFLYSTWSYFFCLSLAFGGMARAMLGNSVLPFLQSWEASVRPLSEPAEVEQ